ncbi:hypothetical protein NUACC21_59130 [Scytonema sp. NUACC21]
MRILLIEDDEVLMNILLQSLTKQLYVVCAAEDGQIAWEYAVNVNYDLILMDVELPKLDGITLCQKLRSNGCLTPILLMTAKDASSDRIRGLDAGADDYLIKPLDLEELQARVRALLRRGEVPHTPVLYVGTLRLDPSSCQVTYGGKELVLTPKEYSLLELFMRNPSRVFSRGNIIEHLWTFEDPPQEESVKSHIKGLRQKLKAAGAVDWIENVYGVGYRLNPQVVSEGVRETKEVAVSSASSPSLEQEFNQAMGGLWNQYQGLMMQRMKVLQKAAAAIADNTLTAELRQSAQQQAHKLAGVLGMFELETGTQLARTVEQLLAENDDLLASQKHELRSLIQQLTNLLNRIELCQAVRTDPNCQGLPILFLTAHRELETVQQVFAAGADDYVVKPVVGAELLARITNRLERIRLLQSFSSKDPLTGLANQPQSSRDLHNLIDQARINGQPASLVLLAVTELRQINTQYGHESGNQVLQRWSRHLQSAFRGGEVMGYWGNGEFVVGISGMTKAEVKDRLSDILTALRQQIFIAPEGTRYQTLCSFAVVEYPNDGLTIQSLYQAASLLLAQKMTSSTLQHQWSP